MMSGGSWNRVPISDVCESVIDCVNKTAPTTDEVTPFKMIRTTNVRNGWINLDEVKHVTEDVYMTWTRRQVPRRGDVILTREAPLGEVGMLRTDESVFLGQRLVSYRAASQKLDNKFLLYILQGSDLQNQIKALGSGATVEHMRVPDAQKLMVPSPPLATQQRIAGILSAYDDLIENNTKRIKILEEMARSLYREWFVHFRFPGHEKVKLVDSPLGRIPIGWKVITLQSVASHISRGVTPKYAEDGPELVVNQKCVRDQRLSLELARPHRSAVSPDKYLNQYDVLINSTGIGTLGRTAQVLEALQECTVDTHVTIVRPGKDIDPHYFGLMLLGKESYFETQGVGATGQTELARTRIGLTEIILPPSALQHRFRVVVEPIRAATVPLSKMIGTLRKTRDLLLPRLISGEIDVSSLPPPP